MSKKYLICDCVGSGQIEILTEASSNGSNFTKFRGKFQEADAKNKNNRMYGRSILEREVNRLQSIINERKLIGELDHPSDSVIHFENASHVVTKLWWEGKILMGEAEVLKTPSGKILESLFESNVPVGISSRGVGTGKNNNEGVMIVDDSFKLITFDVVADPSTYEAYMNTSNENNQNNKINKNNFIKNESNLINTINTNLLIGWLNCTLNKYSKK